MRFVVDAQLPKRIARWLAAQGHDAVHTLDLPSGNRASDGEIIDLACGEDRIVVTKDADFVSSHLIQQRPRKLLLISTGNIGNAALLTILEKNLSAVESVLEDADFVELSATRLIVHG